jgi:hypothetical protein
MHYGSSRRETWVASDANIPRMTDTSFKRQFAHGCRVLMRASLLLLVLCAAPAVATADEASCQACWDAGYYWCIKSSVGVLGCAGRDDPPAVGGDLIYAIDPGGGGGGGGPIDPCAVLVRTKVSPGQTKGGIPCPPGASDCTVDRNGSATTVTARQPTIGPEPLTARSWLMKNVEMSAALSSDPFTQLGAAAARFVDKMLTPCPQDFIYAEGAQCRTEKFMNIASLALGAIGPEAFALEGEIAAEGTGQLRVLYRGQYWGNPVEEGFVAQNPRGTLSIYDHAIKDELNITTARISLSSKASVAKNAAKMDDKVYVVVSRDAVSTNAYLSGYSPHPYEFEWTVPYQIPREHVFGQLLNPGTKNQVLIPSPHFRPDLVPRGSIAFPRPGNFLFGATAIRNSASLTAPGACK